MQRVDQNVVGAMPGAGPHGEVGEVREIAEAPGSFGPHAVELSGQPPCPPGAHPGRQAQPGRCDDQCGVEFPITRSQVHPVITEREVGGQYERGLADKGAVEVGRRGEVVGLADAGADGAVFQTHPDFRRIAVVDMNPERGLSA